MSITRWRITSVISLNKFYRSLYNVNFYTRMFALAQTKLFLKNNIKRIAEGHWAVHVQLSTLCVVISISKFSDNSRLLPSFEFNENFNTTKIIDCDHQQLQYLYYNQIVCCSYEPFFFSNNLFLLSFVKRVLSTVYRFKYI